MSGLSRMHRTGVALGALLAALALAPAAGARAGDGAPGQAPEAVELEPIPPAIARPHRGQVQGEPGVSPELLTEGFLSAHPDLRWRREGLAAYDSHRYADALAQFQRAARYSDKPSQAMIAEMYWRGLGVPQDRPIAYAWMDLAAERLYPNFIAYREAYWQALTPAEQANAISRGQALLAEYGDDAAKPRLAHLLERTRKSATGSRTGYVGFLEIIPMTGPMANSGMRIRGDEYYADKYWKPAQYFALQDTLWNAPPPNGKVTVGEVEVDRASPPAGKDSPSTQSAPAGPR